MKQPYKKLLGILAALFVCGSVNATPINPFPATYGVDDGSELFSPTDSVALTVEFFDFQEILTPDAGGATFGFYYASNPDNLITILDESDFSASSASPSSTALVDFATGVVLDQDSTTIQSLFTPLEENIGFFLTISDFTVYTESVLNALALDMVATFPSLIIPSTYLLGFGSVNESGTPITLALEIVSGITGVSVPAPGALLLIIIGMLLLQTRMISPNRNMRRAA